MEIVPGVKKKKEKKYVFCCLPVGGTGSDVIPHTNEEHQSVARRLNSQEKLDLPTSNRFLISLSFPHIVCTLVPIWIHKLHPHMKNVPSGLSDLKKKKFVFLISFLKVHLLQ